jgi:hypothetical protein
MSLAEPELRVLHPAGTDHPLLSDKILELFKQVQAAPPLLLPGRHCCNASWG